MQQGTGTYFKSSFECKEWDLLRLFLLTNLPQLLWYQQIMTISYFWALLGLPWQLRLYRPQLTQPFGLQTSAADGGSSDFHRLSWDTFRDWGCSGSPWCCFLLLLHKQKFAMNFLPTPFLLESLFFLCYTVCKNKLEYLFTPHFFLVLFLTEEA